MAEGFYVKSTIWLPTDITVNGKGIDTEIITNINSGDDYQTAFELKKVKDVTIQNLSMTRLGSSNRCIKVGKTSGVKLSNLWFKNAEDPIRISGATNWTIENITASSGNVRVIRVYQGSNAGTINGINISNCSEEAVTIRDDSKWILAWAPNTYYPVGTVRKPIVYNGNQYVCTLAGTSGETPPIWPSDEGEDEEDDLIEIDDGTAKWMFSSSLIYPNDITVSNFTLNNNLGGFDLRRIQDTEINGGTISNNRERGISMESCENIKILNATFTGNGDYAIKFSGCKNILFDYITTTGNRGGLRFGVQDGVYNTGITIGSHCVLNEEDALKFDGTPSLHEYTDLR